MDSDEERLKRYIEDMQNEEILKAWKKREYRGIMTNVSKENLEVIREFYNKFCIGRDLSLNTQRNYLLSLRNFSSIVKKPFKEVKEKDIENYIVASQKYSHLTKRTRKIIIKKFFQWLYKMEGDKYPEITKAINNSVSKKEQKILSENILTPEEILKIANATDNLREEALILTLYDSGCRVSEFTSIKLKDIKSDEYGFVLIVSGKTGSRKVRIPTTSSTALVLKDYVNQHPFKDNPESYLFFDKSSNRYGEKLTMQGVGYVLKRIIKRAGIKKKIWPHLLRHSKATEMAKKYNEAFMRNFFGWSKSSRMPEVYIHLSMKDMDDMMLEKEGIQRIENDDKTLKPVKCLKCFELNPVTNRFCGKCATPLDQKSQNEMIAERIIKRIILSSPEIMELIRKIDKEKELD